MLVVGLTGGIASGKSFVSNYLKLKKISVHESDFFINNLYKKPTSNFLSFLKKSGFKKSIINKKINKNTIRDEIFSNSHKRKKLEIYLHKIVGKDRDSFLKKNKYKKIVFLDIPLLFENALEKNCDYVCSTIAPLQIRKKRFLIRPDMSIVLFNKILKIQINNAERKKKSHYLIDTSKTKTNTCLQIDNIIYDILNIIKKK